MQDNNNFDETIKNLANALDEESLQNIINQLSEEKKENNNVTIEPVSDSIANNAKETKAVLKEISKTINNENKTFQEEIKEFKEHEAKVETEENETIEQPKQIEEIKEENKKSDKEKHEELKKQYKEKKEELQQNLSVIEETEKAITEQEFEETHTEKDALAAMKLIASDPNYSEALLQYTDPKVSENQFKLFIIAQCKREIYKILKYSEYLDKLEDRFEKVYIDRLEELSDGMIVRLMQLVVDKIDRGNALINSVIKDKEITNVLVINQQNNTVNNISELTKDKLLQTLYKASQDKAELPSASRAKVVETVTNILKEATEEDIEDIKEDENNGYIIVNNEQQDNLQPDEQRKLEIDKALSELQKQKEGGN